MTLLILLHSFTRIYSYCLYSPGHNIDRTLAVMPFAGGDIDVGAEKVADSEADGMSSLIEFG